MKILHVSDTHYEMDTMWRINLLANRRADCDVVAVTGDVVSKSRLQLPAEWNSWPQRLKLAVPGNHGDHSQAFTKLTRWQTTVPWFGEFAGVLFICAGIALDDVGEKFWSDVQAHSDVLPLRAVVILSHFRPRGPFLSRCRQLGGSRLVLVLHGDEQPKRFSGIEWSVPADGERVFRSHVCSSPQYRPDRSVEKGIAHVIELHPEGSFTANKDQG